VHRAATLRTGTATPAKVLLLFVRNFLFLTQQLHPVSLIAGSERLSLLPSSPIPQCEFDPIAYANLVVDFSEIVPDNLFVDPEFLGDFFVFESLGYQPDDSQLASAGEPCSVAIHNMLASWHFPSSEWLDEGGKDSLA
jgi:hypothetical protein